MKKRLCLVSAALAVSLLFISCKNFLDGSSMIDELEALIEYANSMYVPVELKANIEATKEMSPFVGTYDKSYKKGDSFELSYEPNSSYMFAGWKATPEDSVIFEDKNSLKTKVTINSEGSTIVIEPVVCARPTVSFLPGNAVAVEKNSDVVITFSHELNLTDEVTLDLIKIVDEFGNEIQSTNFLPPEIDETKKVIIFKSNPENLISFEGNTLGITVKVPAVYNYLYENTKVCMEKDTEYSYKINQETSTKLKLSVAAITHEKGSMNLSGAQEFNIGQKQILTVNIKDEEYKFDGWIVQNENGTPLEKETYELYFSFDDDKAKETYINVKNTGSGFTIVPDLKQRPQVSSSFPQLSKVGVDRGTDIQILFNMPMSEESIYWTAAELDKLKIENYEDFEACRYNEAFKTKTAIINDDGEQYYYAYRDDGGKVHFKNIEIEIEGKSYLDEFYFTAPYFQTPTLLVIPTAKMAFEYLNTGRMDVKELPPNSYVDFKITKDMVNAEGVSLYKDCKYSYYVNSHYDTEGPYTVSPDNASEDLLIAASTKVPFELNYNYPIKKSANSSVTFDINKNIGYFNENVLLKPNVWSPNSSEFLKYSDINSFVEKYPLVKPAKTLILYQGKVEDFDSVTEIVLLLEYRESGFFHEEPASEYKTIEISQPISSKGKYTFDAGENRIVFDVSNIPVQGIYSIKLLGVDSLGNKGLLNFYLKDNDASIAPYCMINNFTISKEEIKVTKKNTSDVYYSVTGPAGEYVILKSGKNWNGGNNYNISDFYMAFDKATIKKTLTVAGTINSISKVNDFLLGSLDESTLTDFLFVNDSFFGTLTIFEMIEHEGTNEIELVEYIPPEI